MIELETNTLFAVMHDMTMIYFIPVFTFTLLCICVVVGILWMFRDKPRKAVEE